MGIEKRPCNIEGTKYKRLDYDLTRCVDTRNGAQEHYESKEVIDNPNQR
jgi:hypothetical protein